MSINWLRKGFDPARVHHVARLLDLAFGDDDWVSPELHWGSSASRNEQATVASRHSSDSALDAQRGRLLHGVDERLGKQTAISFPTRKKNFLRGRTGTSGNRDSHSSHA